VVAGRVLIRHGCESPAKSVSSAHDEPVCVRGGLAVVSSVAIGNRALRRTDTVGTTPGRVLRRFCVRQEAPRHALVPDVTHDDRPRCLRRHRGRPRSVRNLTRRPGRGRSRLSTVDIDGGTARHTVDEPIDVGRHSHPRRPTVRPRTE
jgi:hypothetical protein